ncbi:YdiU family protein [Aquisalimonas sp.]|uniref:protein adenylyltransferase SelO n=1 Tax=unclassified Aquisalimonas TaxID=2644645 RepID=UPI0025BBFB18|nr:YdiU family protein [Aquisalimonas sp.]
MLLRFDNTYVQLPERFYARCKPATPAAPATVQFNRGLATELGLPHLERARIAGVFSGWQVPQDAEPIALAYAGHQFGHLVPQLGDGRAVLLGEVVDRNGVRRDVQLKGSGMTPFSRGGDGRCPIGPAMREYLVSEAMHAMGVPTSRALALVTTGERVRRETHLPGAVITRVAQSHVRVGTFEYFAVRGDVEALRILADYVIDRHGLAGDDGENRYLALLREVVRRQAALIALWMNLGFIHGVMNTDNTTLIGETLDYGPCAFLDDYDAGACFSFIDQGGRYRYENQPAVAQWNLMRLAETLLPLLDDDQDAAIEQAQEAVSSFPALYERDRLQGMRRKLGLFSEHPDDSTLMHDLLALLERQRVDYTRFFRRLGAIAVEPNLDSSVRKLFSAPDDWEQWYTRWLERLRRDSGRSTERMRAMHRVNPAVVPRNHAVNAAIKAAEQHGDLAPFQELLSRVTQPFADHPEDADGARPPEARERVLRTFCGT